MYCIPESPSKCITASLQFPSPKPNTIQATSVTIMISLKWCYPFKNTVLLCIQYLLHCLSKTTCNIHFSPSADICIKWGFGLYLRKTMSRFLLKLFFKLCHSTKWVYSVPYSVFKNNFNNEYVNFNFSSFFMWMRFFALMTKK